MEYAVSGSTFYKFFPATFHSFEPKNIPQKSYNIYTLFNSISIGTSQTTKNDENITQPYDSTFMQTVLNIRLDEKNKSRF